MERQSPKRAATPPPAEGSPKRAHSSASAAPTEVLPTAALPDGAAAPECAPSGGAVAAEPTSRAPSPASDDDDHTDVDTDADDDVTESKTRPYPFPRYTDADAPHLWCVEYTVLDSGDQDMYRFIGDQRTFSAAELEAFQFFRKHYHLSGNPYPAFVDPDLEARVYFARLHRVIQRLFSDYQVFEDAGKWPNSRFPAAQVLQLTVERPRVL